MILTSIFIIIYLSLFYRLEYLVLDEADKLFEMGFIEQLDDILSVIPKSGVVKSIFSATLPSGVETIANTVLYNPIRVIIGEMNAGADTIEQQLLFVGKEHGKIVAMRNLFHEVYISIIFLLILLFLIYYYVDVYRDINHQF